MSEPDRPMLMREIHVVRVAGKIFVPIVLLFALYVQFHGDYGPGGGFQAGVIFAAAFILYAMIFSLGELDRALPPRAVELAIPAGVLLYAGVGLATMLLGGNFLDYNALNPEHPAVGQHTGILLVEAGVGLTVAAVMLTIYRSFALRSRR